MAMPKEPRQKMINMMYLVLTALLALNVSAEILNAFKTVNNSLETSSSTVNLSTNAIMSSLKEKTTKDETKDKAQMWYPKAEQATKLTADVNTYIQGLKDEILKASGLDPATGKYREDDLDVPARIMVDKKAGVELKKRLEDYQKSMLAIDPKIAAEFKNSLGIDLSTPKSESKSNLTWENAYFHMVPSVAALTILSKFQNDVKTAENKVVNYCHEQVGKVEVVFDSFAPILGQSSTYLMPGQDLDITAGIGAFNSKAQPDVYIGGQKVKVENGIGTYSTKVGNTGGAIAVKINYIDQNGKPQTVEKKIEYSVGQTSTAIALDKLNVLFIGVDNEVSISASGGAEKIQASLTGANGSLSKVAAGKYVARVNPPDGECNINVTVDGKTVSQRFRVRSIPDPVAMVGTKKSGDAMSAAEFRSQAGVRAILENFFYETQFSVTSFRIIAEGEGFPDPLEFKNDGAAWNANTRNVVNRVQKGSIITIDQIRCVGPDKRTRALPAISYELR